MNDEDIFDRETRVTVGDLEVSDLRCVFKVAKDIEKDPNTAQIAIFNLSETNRSRIAEYNAEAGPDRVIPVRIEAGYKSLGGARLIYEGQLRETVSQKQGHTWVTEVKSGDGETSLRVATISQKFTKGTQPLEVVKALLAAIGLGEGNLKDVQSLLVSGGSSSFSISGAVSYHIENWTRPYGVSFSIQNNTPMFSAINEPGKGRVVSLTPESGLIGSPVSEANNQVSCASRILPDLDIGNVFNLESESVSGNFKVDHCEFSGDTRGAVYEVSLHGSRY